jgi:hypothetical protein
MSPTTTTYAPAVLLVEDDLPAREYLTRRFYSETSLGIVVAKDLMEAKVLIDSRDIQIDAIVADLYFSHGMDAPEANLRDGIDILKYGANERPRLLNYVNSYWADREELVKKADELRLTIRQWFHKQPLMPGDTSAPWAQVERDLIEARLVHDASGLKSEELTGEVTEAIRRQLCPIRKTYLQGLDSPDLTLIRPIEVLTWVDEDGVYHSSAPKIGLLTDGSGETVMEAIEQLRDLIVEHEESLNSAPSIEGYALFVKTRLSEFIKRGE